MDLSPSMHWPEPVLAEGVDGDRSPVLTTIEYRIPPENKARFLERMAELGRARRRLGAYDWGVLEDAAQPGCFVEYFFESSWLQHLRHHERVSGADRVLQEEILALQLCSEGTARRHLLGPKDRSA